MISVFWTVEQQGQRRRIHSFTTLSNFDIFALSLIYIYIYIINRFYRYT